MIESQNGQSQSEPEQSKPKGRFTGERLLRERPRVYRKVVELLAEPGMSINQITKFCRVSEHTVRAVRDREAVSIAERKQRLMSIFGNVAEIGAERMEELAGKASLRDAGTTAGIATDKLLALTGQMQSSKSRVVIMPTPERPREGPRASTRAGCDRTSVSLSERRPVVSLIVIMQADGVLRTKAVAAEARAPSAFLSRTFISLAVADRRVIPIRA